MEALHSKYVILRGPASVTRGPVAVPSPSGLERHAARVSIDLDELTPKDSRKVAQDEGVVAVAPVIPLTLIAPKIMSDASPAGAGPTWGVSAVKADNSAFAGNGVVVAVLDTGIDATHPAFAGVELVQRNFTEEGAVDNHGHGTHCAGTIFGRDVDGTRIGVAVGVTKALIGKVLGQGGGSSERLVQAIQWAVDNGANIISMSIGIDFPGLVKHLIEERGWPTQLAATKALEQYRQNVLLFERLTSLVTARNPFGDTATIIVAAAGNESQREVRPDFEVDCSPPAIANDIVSVAALGQPSRGQLRVADFSNINATVAGPGEAVDSARLGGGLTRMSGTSMATPHVAGVAALWAEKLKGQGQLSAGRLRAAVQDSGVFGSIAPEFDASDYGAGLVQSP